MKARVRGQGKTFVFLSSCARLGDVNNNVYSGVTSLQMDSRGSWWPRGKLVPSDSKQGWGLHLTDLGLLGRGLQESLSC